MRTAAPLRTVPVDLGDRSYDICIGPGALYECADPLRTIIAKGKGVIVADSAVWALHGNTVTSAFGTMPVIEIPSGEASKSIAQYGALCDALLATRIGRDGVIIAVGGGVIGDLAGFAAATLRRGCGFVQVPTTLLAQVDSSVGGKTAINARTGKNLIGAFYQPRLVIADTDLLATLSPREIHAGYAEVVKYGLLGDAGFFRWLETNSSKVISQNPSVLTAAIETCCQMKANIVRDDETEQGGRALLNLGHTFGHALEGAMGYSGALLHGEGVSAGIAMAFRFSARLGHCTNEDAQRAEKHLSSVGLPTALADIPGLKTTPQEQLSLMYQDKKVEGGALTLILTRGIGEAFVTKGVEPTTLLQFLTEEVSSVPS